METLKLLVRVIIFLLFTLTMTSCSSGWSVANYELTPQDTTVNTVFMEITSSDSVVHWYSGRVYDGSNWCYRHDDWEEVSRK